MIYSVSGMLTISEDHVSDGCHVRTIGLWFGAGMTGDRAACCLVTDHYAVARWEGDRHRASLDSIGRVGVRPDTGIVIEKKRLL
jgi:hypothetical protein